MIAHSTPRYETGNDEQSANSYWNRINADTKTSKALKTRKSRTTTFIHYQNGLHAASGFEMYLLLISSHLCCKLTKRATNISQIQMLRAGRVSEPKHSSHPAEAKDDIKKVKPPCICRRVGRRLLHARRL